MRYPEFHYQWAWELQSSREALWPLISDTNHFNRDAGIPEVHDVRTPGEDLDNARRHLRFSVFGVPVEWEEEPFEWVRPSRFTVMRRYMAGPIASMRSCAELIAQPGGGTRLVYQVWALPRNPLGMLAIPLQIGLLSRRNFGATFQRYDRMARMGQAMPQHPAEAHFAPGGRMRLAELGKALVAKGQPAALVERLTGLVEHGDDMAIAHMRPYVLADAWGEPRRAVLNLFLWATRLGLVDFQWELLCPLCRGVKQSGQSLRDVQPQVHCEVCRIDFTVNFDRSVELTFQPNSAVRPIDVGEYCIGGPQVTPHIVAQQLLPPAVERTLALPLEPGRYRLRTLALRGGQLFTVDPGGAAETTLCASDDGWPEGETHLNMAPALRLRNESSLEQLFVFEHMAWSDQAVTAAEVTSLQLFRDLFANEALRPDAQISVGSLTVLFTDLRDSTRLYRQIGDAVAFGHVMSHFDVLREAIAAEDGALVKTIGDAVMAVFRRPMAALQAILKAQQMLAAHSTGASSLVLKAGIHHGPCIAVTLNDRLDYFGSTVNIAARVQNLSVGGDVVMTSAVHDDPEVQQWLSAQGQTILGEPFEATLKGLEDQFHLWRLTPVTR